MTSFSKLIGEKNVMYVVSYMISIESYTNKFGFFPPAAHDTEGALEFWAKNARKFNIEDVPNHSFNDAKHIVDPEGYYDAVWVRAGYDGYRKVLAWHAKTYGADDDSISHLDADHVINRATVLKNFDRNSWIMLFPVTATSNRSFGAAIEKSKLAIKTESGEISYSVLHFMKTHVFGKIKNKQDVEAAIKEMSSLIMFDTEAEKERFLEKAEKKYLKVRDWD